jgi:hypothetical protein
MVTKVVFRGVDMDVEEILAQLERNHTQVPRIALEEADAHREEIIPRLLEVLEQVAKDPARFLGDQERDIQVYAMYLLAQFREPRAYPLLVKIFSAPGEIPFELAGSVVTQDLASILASASDGDPSGMTELVENEEANEYARASALDGLITLMAFGRLTRGDVMAYLRHLFQILERKPSAVWDGLANVCADLCPVEFMMELRQAYDDGLVDPGSIGWDEVEEALEMGPDTAWEKARRRYRLIMNTADAITWWGCFHADAGKEEGAGVGLEADDNPAELEDHTDSDFPFLGSEQSIPEPYRRTEPKVGRNARCPCGSGKKYKRCCGR